MFGYVFGLLAGSRGTDRVIVDRERLATGRTRSCDGSFITLDAGGFCDAS